MDSLPDDDLDRLPRRDLAALYFSAVAARDALAEQHQAAVAEVDRLTGLLQVRLSTPHPRHPGEPALGKGVALLCHGFALQVSSAGQLKTVRLVADEPDEAGATLRLSPPGDDAGEE